MQRLVDRIRAHRDEGFTLIELMMVMAITGILTAALATAIISALDNSRASTHRLASSHDAEISARWFEADAASATQKGVSTVASSCTDGATSTPLVSFSWSAYNASDISATTGALGSAESHVVAWVLENANLVRLSCVGGGSPTSLVMSRNVSGTPTVVCVSTSSPSCTGLTVSQVTLGVTEANDTIGLADNYSYSLIGTIRQNSNTTSPSGVQTTIPLLIFATGSKGINLNGGSTLSVLGTGTAVVDSSDPDAIDVSSNGTITGSYDTLVGGGCKVGNSACPTSPTFKLGTTTKVADPFANLPAPTCAGAGNQTGNTYGPGSYTNLTLNSSANKTMQPGVYCLTGGLSISGSGNVTASGVLLYMTTGILKITGSGTITMSAYANPGSIYNGLLVAHPSSFTGGDQLQGGAGSTISGTFYGGGNGSITLGGGPTYTGIQVIAGSLTVSGGATATIG